MTMGENLAAADLQRAGVMITMFREPWVAPAAGAEFLKFSESFGFSCPPGGIAEQFIKSGGQKFRIRPGEKHLITMFVRGDEHDRAEAIRMAARHAELDTDRGDGDFTHEQVPSSLGGPAMMAERGGDASRGETPNGIPAPKGGAL